MSDWSKHVARWRDCQLCPLCEQRSNIVLARGQIPADVVFIGEAPGQSEDALGKPFVGPAGKLLDRIILKALPGHVEIGEDGSTEHWVVELRHAITNLVACFPRLAKETSDHQPKRDEIAKCFPRLKEFIRMCKPRLLVLVGALAKRHVVGQAQFSVRKDYGLEWLDRDDHLRIVDIMHPAAILRAPMANRGLLEQRAVVTIAEAIEDLDR